MQTIPIFLDRSVNPAISKPTQYWLKECYTP